MEQDSEESGTRVQVQWSEGRGTREEVGEGGLWRDAELQVRLWCNMLDVNAESTRFDSCPSRTWVKRWLHLPRVAY